MITGYTFQETYYKLLDYILANGEKVTVRGQNMLEVMNITFKVMNPRARLLELDSRKGIYKYIFGELLWYLSGKDDVSFIDKYAKMWKNISDDGIHANSAYGKYIFSKMPSIGYGSYYGDYSNFVENTNDYKSQWDFVKETLKKDPYSRQAVIHIKPVQMYDTKDVTCTYFMQFFIRNNKLNLTVCMRSNDILKGTTFDVFMFTFMQELMAAELGVELGDYTHIACNLHIYENDLDKIRSILNENARIKNTKIFNSIPANFRDADLPILLDIERLYSKEHGISNIDEYNKLYNKLSACGRDIVHLLVM